MKIPSNKLWTQDNSGDVLGVLGASTNMAFDTVGKAMTARKAVSVAGSRNDSDFGYPLAINYFDGKYVALTSDEIYTFSAPSYNITQLSWPPAVSLSSDAVIFNGLYVISTNTALYTWNGGTVSSDWVDEGGSLTTGVPHPMAVRQSFLHVGNGNQVKTFTAGYVAGTTLTLPSQFQVTSIRVVGTFIYVAVKNLNGGNARIFVWDGDGTDANYECEVGASWVFSMTEYKSTVAAITSEGQLGVVSGTTFVELAALPVYHNPHAKWQGSSGLRLNGKVFNRGMCTIGDTIYLNIDGEIDTGFIPEMKSGLWVFDPNVGLYHRSSNSTDRVISDADLTRSGDTLTTSNPHQLKQGDAVAFDTTSGLTGVTDAVSYYVSVESPTQIKLATSRKGLQAGRYIKLGGTPGSLDVLRYAQNNDNGTLESTSGAIIPTVYQETPHPNFESEVLWGSRIDDVDGTGIYCLYSFADSYNIGSFTTQRTTSDNIDQSWKELYAFVDGLNVENEQVVMKVQTEYEEPTRSLTGAWLDTSTVNSIDDFTLWQDIEDGDEIAFIDGYGRGRTAHVIEKTVSGATVSIKLDESIGTINESCELYRTTFRKVGAYNLDNKVKEKIKAGIDSLSAPWIAIKVELRGFTPAVNYLELSNAVHSKGN